jgi:hypothetical protein
MTEGATATQPAPSQAAQAVAADIGAAISNQNQQNSQTLTSQTLTPQQQAAPIVETQNASAEIAFNPFAEVSAPERIPFDKIVPDTYKEKEWVKNLSKTEDPTSEFFKQFEHAQSLIGSRQGLAVPGEGATPEQVKAFHKALGVPDDVKAYEAKAPEWAPEDKPLADSLASMRPPGFMEALKKSAMEAGINPKQFQKVFADHEKLALTMLKNNEAARKQLETTKDTKFSEMVSSIHGQETSQVLDRGKKLVESLLDPRYIPAFKRADPETVALLAGAMDGVYKKFYTEDSFSTGIGTSSPVAQGMQARAELFKLATKLSQMNQMDPNYDKLQRQVNEGYKNLPAEALNQPLSLT